VLRIGRESCVIMETRAKSFGWVTEEGSAGREVLRKGHATVVNLKIREIKRKRNAAHQSAVRRNEGKSILLGGGEVHSSF